MELFKNTQHFFSTSDQCKITSRALHRLVKSVKEKRMFDVDVFWARESLHESFSDIGAHEDSSCLNYYYKNYGTYVALNQFTHKY